MGWIKVFNPIGIVLKGKDNMKIALASIKIDENNINNNVEKIINITNRIIQENDKKIDFIIFPEDCFTALSLYDDPKMDIRLGKTIDSSEVSKIRETAMEKNIFLGFGFLETYEEKLYDSYIVIDDLGKIIFNYRRIHPGWHANSADKNFYGHGEKLVKFDTKFGSFVILICGELFDEDLIQKANKLNADFLINPILRAYGNFSKKWLDEEIKFYAKQVEKVDCLSFLINGITNNDDVDNDDDNYFGGAWVVSRMGTIISSLNPLTEGYLIYDDNED